MGEGVIHARVGAVDATWQHMKRMGLIAAALIGSTGVAVTALMLPATATADPADDPCALMASFLCRFVPIAPDLDGGVDLTTQVRATVPATAPAESLPPADICANRCR